MTGAEILGRIKPPPPPPSPHFQMRGLSLQFSKEGGGVSLVRGQFVGMAKRKIQTILLAWSTEVRENDSRDRSDSEDDEAETVSDKESGMTGE